MVDHRIARTLILTLLVFTRVHLTSMDQPDCPQTIGDLEPHSRAVVVPSSLEESLALYADDVSTSPIVTTFYDGDLLNIQSGPICHDNARWYHTSTSSGLTGWINRRDLVYPLIQGSVTSVAFSPDGKQLLVSTSDFRLRLWDVQTGKKRQIYVYKGTPPTEVTPFTVRPGSPIRPTALTPKGNAILTIAYHKTNDLVLLDVQTGHLLATLPTDQTTLDMALAYSPDGKYFARSVWSNIQWRNWIELWDTSLQQKVRTYARPDPDLPAELLRFSPDNQLLVAGIGGHAFVWRVQTGEIVQTLDDVQTVSGQTVCFPGNSQSLITADNSQHADAGVRLRDIKSGKTLNIYAVANNIVHSIACSPDGRYLVTAYGDLWNVQTAEKVRMLQRPESAPPLGVLTFSPDSKQLAGGDEIEPTVRLWDAESGKLIAQYAAYQER